jgi:hypothetical protein
VSAGAGAELVIDGAALLLSDPPPRPLRFAAFRP